MIEELIERQLNESNYLIDICSKPNNENYTAIYFSSNGIFGNKNQELFEEKILKKNTFEFYKTRIKKASKHIYLRDVTLGLYLKGINNELNSVEKVLEFLKKETLGSKIITVGSSAGGFASVLFGILLNAEYIISFSPQYVLSNHYDWSKYLNILDMVKSSEIPIFTMIPSGHGPDIEQFNLVKDFKNIYGAKIKSSAHGIPICKNTLKNIINSDLEKLKKIYVYKDSPIKENIFALKHFGLLKIIESKIKKNISCMLKINSSQCD